MFTEFLENHPMEELLRGGTRTLYPPAADRQAWDGIPPVYRDEISRMAGNMRGRPIRPGRRPGSWPLPAPATGRRTSGPILPGGGSCAPPC